MSGLKSETTVTAERRYDPLCPVPYCAHILDREPSLSEAWQRLQAHIRIDHEDLVEEVPYRVTRVYEELPKTVKE